MTTLIEIKLNPDESNFKKLRICVDCQDVDYSVDNNDTILVSCDIDMGIHQLAIQLVDGTTISIIDVLINTASVSHTLYMSYIKTASGNINQPATTLWNQSLTWILPFGNPISYWLGLTLSKIQPFEFGKNLYETYDIMYPDTIQIKTKQPRVIQDFFKHNFDFYCRPKTDVNFLPQRKCNIDMSTYNTQEVLDEITENRAWVQEHQKPYSQRYYDVCKLPENPALWTVLQVYSKGKCILPTERLVKLQSLIKQIPVNRISEIYLRIIDPGGAISPHTDKKTNHVPGMYGCNVLCIPLAWPSDTYFKFASGGGINSNSTWFINTTDHEHAAVNDSNQTRVILTIKLDPTQNYHLLA